LADHLWYTLADHPWYSDGRHLTTEYFATFHLRAKVGVQLILHLGAKVRATAATGIEIADPSALLTWLAKDRATVALRDLEEINAKQAPFVDLIRAWIAYV